MLVVLLLIILGLLILLFRTGIRHNALLNTLGGYRREQEKYIRDRDLLLVEINHRVKNNLQIVTSMLSLQAEYVADPSAFNALKSGQDRIKSMALIHQYIYQDDNLISIPVRSYFEKLVQSLFDSYEISPDRIVYRLDIQDIRLDIDTLIPIGLIVNELVSNALRHAFPASREGHITIVFKEESENLRLLISDNGIGLDSKGGALHDGSFGFKLIHAFREQLDASVDFDLSAGTSIIVSIKEYRKVA